MKKAVDDTTDDLDKFKSQANDKFQNLGNMGCQISMGGIQSYIDCWLKIKDMYWKEKKMSKKASKSYFQSQFFMRTIWFFQICFQNYEFMCFERSGDSNFF